MISIFRRRIALSGVFDDESRQRGSYSRKQKEGSLFSPLFTTHCRLITNDCSGGLAIVGAAPVVVKRITPLWSLKKPR